MINRLETALLALLLIGTPAMAAETFEEAVALYADKDYKTAFQVAKPLAESGDARAMAMLGTLYQQGLGVKRDAKAAIKWLTGAAEKGNSGAQFALAVHYLDQSAGTIEVRAIVRCEGKTGVEMEAMTACAIAALTIYDMCKSAEKGISIESLQLVRKSGGKSGLWERNLLD